MLTNDVMHFAMDEKWAFFQFFPNKNTIEMKDDTFVVLFYVYIIAHFFFSTQRQRRSRVVGRVILLLQRNFSLFVWYNLLDDGLTRDKKVVEGLQLDLGATTMQ